MSKLVTIKLSLTEDEWCEVANAVESKMRLIEQGDYGEGEAPEDNEKWVKTLTGAMGKIETALQENSVTW